MLKAKYLPLIKNYKNKTKMIFKLKKIMTHKKQSKKEDHANRSKLLQNLKPEHF